MSPRRFEPDVLRLGRLFDAQVKSAYGAGAQDLASPPKPTTVERGSGRKQWYRDDRGHWVERQPPGARLGRRGYVDLLLEGADEESDLPFQVVIEIKNTDWDRRAPHRLKPNLDRHRRQVWTYLEPILKRVDSGEVAWAQAAIVYPTKPRTPGRADYVEQVLAGFVEAEEDEAQSEGFGISVIWYDELLSRRR